MTAKKFAKTTYIETKAVPIKGSDKLVLVYVKDEDGIRYVVMEKSVYEDSSTGFDDIIPYRFRPDYYDVKGVNPSYNVSYRVITSKQFAKIVAGKSWYNTYEDVVNNFIKYNFGAELKDDFVVVGMANWDNSYYDLNEKMISTWFINSYLEKYIDIKSLVDNEKDNPNIKFYPHCGSVIYYVPGNGNTVTIGVKLSDEKFIEMKTSKLASWERDDFAIHSAGLSKYVRDKVLDDEVSY